MSLLKVDNIHVYYGAIHAIKGISFEVNEGEIVTLIGANGAGKSTTLNTIAGLLKPRSGSITFEGRNLLGMKAHKLVSQGMALCPEGQLSGSGQPCADHFRPGGIAFGRLHLFSGHRHHGSGLRVPDQSADEVQRDSLDHSQGYPHPQI